MRAEHRAQRVVRALAHREPRAFCPLLLERAVLGADVLKACKRAERHGSGLPVLAKARHRLHRPGRVAPPCLLVVRADGHRALAAVLLKADARRPRHIEPVKPLGRKLPVHAGKDSAAVHACVVPGGHALVPPADARMQAERESPVVGLLEPGKNAARCAAGRGAAPLGVADESLAVRHDKALPVARGKLAVGRFSVKRLLAHAACEGPGHFPVHPDACRIGVAVDLGTELLEHRRDGPGGSLAVDGADHAARRRVQAAFRRGRGVKRAADFAGGGIRRRAACVDARIADNPVLPVDKPHGKRGRARAHGHCVKQRIDRVAIAVDNGRALHREAVLVIVLADDDDPGARAARVVRVGDDNRAAQLAARAEAREKRAAAVKRLCLDRVARSRIGERKIRLRPDGERVHVDIARERERAACDDKLEGIGRSA